MNWKVYVLFCPVKKKVRYIGICGDIEKRYNQHLSCKESPKRTIWIKWLKAKNKQPIIKVVAEFEFRPSAEMFESSLIKSYLITGEDLLNIQSRKII